MQSRRTFVAGALAIPPLFADDPPPLTLEAAAERLRAGKVTSVELTEACLHRIEKLNGTVNADTLTPIETFRARTREVFAALAATGAEGVVLNVPDVTVSPFLFSIGDIQELLAANGVVLSEEQIQFLFGVRRGDHVILTGVQAIALGQRPTREQVLTRRELKQIKRRTRQFNATLRAEADALGWAYVDANAFLNDVDRRGYHVPGVGTLTTDYLGGIFSLDGVHPTNTGQALVAKLVLEAINAKYGTSFDTPDIAAIAAADPLTCGARTAKRADRNDLLKLEPVVGAMKRLVGT